MSRPALAAAGLAVALSTAALVRGPSSSSTASIAALDVAAAAAPTLPRCTMVDGDQYRGTIDVRDTDVKLGCWVAFREPWQALPVCEVLTDGEVRLDSAPSFDRLVIPGATFGARLHYECH